jgi:erythromycin esterase-like protein
VSGTLRGPRLQHSIGVIYRSDRERWSRYFHARLNEQFDALIHLDETLDPLEPTAKWEEGESPETLPSDL